MFTIANSFLNQTAFAYLSTLLSQNLQVRRATELLDETLYCMIASHDFQVTQVCEPIDIATPQMKQ